MGSVAETSAAIAAAAFAVSSNPIALFGANGALADAALYHIPQKCVLVEKKIALSEEEYKAQMEKMIRIKRKPETAEKFKYGKVQECLPTRFCDVAVNLHQISMDKRNFTMNIPGKDTDQIPYKIEMDKITSTTTDGKPREFLIKTWNPDFSVVSISFEGKEYNSKNCKSAEEEEVIRKKLAAEIENKTLQERLKGEEEIKARELAEQQEKEKLEEAEKAKELREQARIAREEREKAQFQVQKLGAVEEESAAVKLAKEKAAKEKAEKERIERESIGKEKIKN
jgi:hypothetical protein